MAGRIGLNAAVLVVATVAASVVPAAAQMNAMEEQRCVWQCLAASRGASDPAYHACVQSRCAGRPTGSMQPRQATPAVPPVVAQGWQPMRGIAYPAVGTCLGRSPCLIISCPSRGAMAMELHVADRGWQPDTVLRLRFGGEAFRTALPARESTDARWRWPISEDLLGALRSGSDVVLEIEGAEFRLSLAGSGRAIGGIEDRCR